MLSEAKHLSRAGDVLHETTLLRQEILRCAQNDGGERGSGECDRMPVAYQITTRSSGSRYIASSG